MELTAILDAIKTNPSLVDGLLQPIFETDKGKTALTNRVNTEVTSKISEEISKTHQRYDDDIFEVLGVRPGTKEGGQKQKTYEFLKDKLKEYKTLLDQKDSLTKDAEVARLTTEIEEVKKQGGASVVQKIFDEAKSQWATEKAGYEQKIAEAGAAGTTFQIKTQLAAAKAGLQFSPDVSDEIKNIVLTHAENALLANAKVEGDKVTFFKADGTPYVNGGTAEAMTAEEVLKNYDGIKTILKKDGQVGGGANPDLPSGGVTTVKVEGKDTKKLEIPTGSFTTQLQFQEVASKALLASGVTKRDESWDTLMNEAYLSNNVASLPQQ